MLGRIWIASPCSANWELMKGDDQVRFCVECKKHVYNISAMTKLDAETLLRETDARICTRFYQRADGTILTEDCPVGLRGKAARVRRRVSFAISGWVGFAAAFAQAPQPPDRFVQLDQNAQPEFSGVVADVTGAVIPGAAVTLLDEKSKTTFKVRANEVGEFRITAPRAIYTLTVEVPGFKLFKKEAIAFNTKVRMELRMDVGFMMMGAVVAVVEPVPSPLPDKLK